MSTHEFSSLTVRSIRRALNTMLLPSPSLGLVLLLTCLFGCGGKQAQRASTSDAMPELSDEIIRERINDARVRDVPEVNGTSQPITWNFDEDEPKEIGVVEKHMDGTRATIVLDIKTRSSPRAGNQRHLAGQIRTEWALQTGWVLRRWEIVRTENISMTYRDLPKPAEQNSNR